MPEYLSPGVYVEQVPPSARPIAGVGTGTAGFIGIVPDSVTLPAPIKGKAGKFTPVTVNMATPAREAKLITSWSEFVKNFGDLVGEEQEPTATEATTPVIIDNGYRRLTHAVYGFFANGGTRCHVVRITSAGDHVSALDALAAIDEIAIVAIPGVTTTAEQVAVIDHCEDLKDRFAVLDGTQTDSFTELEIRGGTAGTDDTPDTPGTKYSSYAAIYFPWIKVFDPAQKLMEPTKDGNIIVPPSGHIAGVYARVGGERGSHKAPGNEVIRGALDVEHRLTKAHQKGLNPKGVNVIRSFDSNIKIWGARTLGGDDNGEFRYISTRRFFNFLRESIDEGTQFVVFEPNSPALWQRIKRSVGDFLLRQWRDGALFGETPDKAFFVRCDEETNPPEVREAGQVVTEIGVAIVKPAEFVIFRIQQTTG